MPSGRTVFRNVWLKAWLSVFSVPLFIQSISSPNRPTCYHDNLIWSLLQTFQRWILRGCVHMGRSRLGSVIRGHSDHDTSKKSFNPFPGCIRQFLWRAMIRMTSDYWSWSESPHWSAPLGALPGYGYVTLPGPFQLKHNWCIAQMQVDHYDLEIHSYSLSLKICLSLGQSIWHRGCF